MWRESLPRLFCARRLPGIGKKRADAILALRTRLGRFKRPTDLLRVRGLGARRLKRLLPHLVVDPPPEPGGT
jgi:competence protein ComEA